MAALTAYLTSTADTLAGASGAQLTNSAPSSASTNVGSQIAKTTGWCEVWAKAQNTLNAQPADPAPTGDGWIWDVTTLEGNTIAAGTWTPTVTLNVSSACTATVIVRAYKRSSGGVYTKIGTDMSKPTVSLTTSATAIAITGVSQPAMAFSTGDKLYVDVFVNVTVAGGSTIGSVTITDNQGANSAVVTPGYALTPSTATVPRPLVILQSVNRASVF